MAKGELDLQEKFRVFLKHRREAKGYNQKELAIKVFGDIANPKQRISKIETGVNSNVTLSTMQKILEVLDADINFTTL